MQNAKDTFYLTLRNRLATVNPARTMTLRSVTRPGILVEDAEPFTAAAAARCLHACAGPASRPICICPASSRR